MFQRIFFIILFFISLSLFAEENIKDRLFKADDGDFIVTELGKMRTILIFRKIEKNKLLLEEITVPSHDSKKITSWKKWVKNLAPGHIAWNMYEIDLENDQMLESFSFSKSAWFTIDDQYSLFTTLLKLPFTLLPYEKRKKIGPPPNFEEMDRRSVWNPPMIVEGEKISYPSFIVYETKWPKDNTELSNKRMELYFDIEGKFPFPFWIQVYGAHGSAYLKVIDTGKNLVSFYSSIPHRKPRFLSQPTAKKEKIEIKLEIPKYFLDFDLLALKNNEKAHPIEYSIYLLENETYLISFPKSTLVNNTDYQLLLIPIEEKESFIQTESFSFAH